MTESEVSLIPSRDLCGTMLVHRRLLNESLTYRARRAAIENRALSYRLGVRTAARTEVASIPVVVHVVHRTAAQNITDAQIRSQIDVLNHDFRATNPDVDTVPDVWKPLVADTRIEFQLATQDPNGAATTGITRTATTRNSFDTDDAVKADTTGGADPWPSDQYLNIWVCQLAGSLLGYAQFPGGSPLTDGVVIRHSAFGTEGTASAPFDLGRTATHEVGHWLNLFHIWGDDGGGCSNDDEVADTPNQARDNIGVPTFPHITCGNGPNGDMFVNYMDYSDDVAMFMFTLGQKERMDACLEGSRASFLVAQRAPATPGGPASASEPAGPPSEETDDVARLRKKVRRLRRKNKRLTAVVDDIRAALASSAGSPSTAG